jgi:myosin-5
MFYLFSEYITCISQPLLDFLGLSAKGPTTDGLFGILDEQTAIGSGTDDKFLAKVIATHKTKKELMSDRTKSKADFKVFHYAGEVTYKTDGFVVRNADKLYDGLVALCEQSTVPFIATLFSKETMSRYTTQGKKFLTQLQDLEKTVDATWSRFIRCVKPNQAKEPNIFESHSSLEQLKFSGVFEAVAIRKQG